MRKVFMVLTLMASLLGITMQAGAASPPTCGDNCPFVR